MYEIRIHERGKRIGQNDLSILLDGFAPRSVDNLYIRNPGPYFRNRFSYIRNPSPYIRNRVLLQYIDY